MYDLDAPLHKHFEEVPTGSECKKIKCYAKQYHNFITNITAALTASAMPKDQIITH